MKYCTCKVAMKSSDESMCQRCGYKLEGASQPAHVEYDDAGLVSEIHLTAEQSKEFDDLIIEAHMLPAKLFKPNPAIETDKKEDVKAAASGRESIYWNPTQNYVAGVDIAAGKDASFYQIGNVTKGFIVSSPPATQFTLNLPEICVCCHKVVSKETGMSLEGKTRKGYAHAECIAPISKLAANNVLAREAYYHWLYSDFSPARLFEIISKLVAHPVDESAFRLSPLSPMVTRMLMEGSWADDYKKQIRSQWTYNSWGWKAKT